MAELAEPLESRGFRAVATDLPGGWATDGEWTVVVRTRPIHGGPLNDRCHSVRVYATPARDVGIDAELAGRATDTSDEAAIRSALERAGYPAGDGR